MRRVVSLKVTASSKVVLAQLDSPLELSEQVNTLCLSAYDSFHTSCYLSGFSASFYSQTIPTSPTLCEGSLCLSTETVESAESWSGVMVCVSDLSPSVFQGVAVFSNPFSATPLTDLVSLVSLINGAAPAPLLDDNCDGFRSEYHI